MSLYAMVHGTNDGAPLALWLAGYSSTSQVGRFRDAWVEKDDHGELRVAIYTRNGGGNREECWHTDLDDESMWGDEGCPCLGLGGPACRCPACFANERAGENPLHLFGKDDDFDCTYRTEYFRLRAGLSEEWLAALRNAATPAVDTVKRWLDLIDALKGGPA